MRRDDPYHDWFIDEPLLWFALWLLCIAAGIALSVLLPPSLPDTIIASSPTLVSAFFSALWMRSAFEWVGNWRWRRTLKQITDAGLDGPLTLSPYLANPNETGNFPWSVGVPYSEIDHTVTAQKVKEAVQRLRDQHAPWNGGHEMDLGQGSADSVTWDSWGGAQDAAGEGETPADS